MTRTRSRIRIKRWVRTWRWMRVRWIRIRTRRWIMMRRHRMYPLAVGGGAGGRKLSVGAEFLNFRRVLDFRRGYHLE